jgi:cytochrome c-type biogenesis protein CcmH/NrfG
LLLAPHDWFTCWLAARIRYYYDQFALALKMVQQALELNASHFLLWLQLGQCQQALGLLMPARTSYTQAQQLNPQCRAAKVALTELSNSSIGTRLRGFWRRILAIRH